MFNQLRVSAKFPIRAKEIYKAWLSSKLHTEMTGGEAVISSKIGGKFKAWDGYITGKNLDLIKDKRIIQLWRSSEFTERDLDSILVVNFEDVSDGCKVTIVHSQIPKWQGASYKQGWIDYYLLPMKAYFSK
ncbi:MAG: Activator of Hsp90 ATPase 1 family protein [Ignavibacteria bacterium]|nr:MAG: Activator of Hsp90 ATPase 1 family protein [Ignavibacteria bacterium]KAF0158564.1 MAG: Activator of Hsp90 ATPase 1 family protein [Ignavibacteria bacterium]